MRGKPVLFIPASALSRLPRARYEGCSPTPKNLARRPQLISCPWGPARCARAAQRAAAELRCCSLGSVRLGCPDSLGHEGIGKPRSEPCRGVRTAGGIRRALFRCSAPCSGSPAHLDPLGQRLVWGHFAVLDPL